ncbi:hypothetical protein H7992_21610 [Sporosarcina sp. resist]|uniref:hypothetical protein n=1 Tax=Sporosarcina sp. resist TaxID=2762563 RepID=UPI00164DF7D9|nr:hypothetical protein [Sporosarcina sp. resist]QNK87733.1 hypothetical protein H7992_21610 [Sporosarcina sp. resist]
MSLEIGVISAIAGLLFGYFTFSRNRDRDVRSSAAEDAVVRTKLDNISVGVDTIRLDMKSNERAVAEVSDRVIRVEESAKQAHKRIDGIERNDDK